MFDTNTTDEFGVTQYVDKEKEAEQTEKELECKKNGGHYWDCEDGVCFCEECDKKAMVGDEEPDYDAMKED